MAIPRHDFFQSPSDLTVSLYVRGYDAVKDAVDVRIAPRVVSVRLPPKGEAEGSEFEMALAGEVGGGTWRVLGSKIEIKLTKAEPVNWTSLLAPSPSTSTSTEPKQFVSATPPAPKASTPAASDPPAASSSTAAPAPTPRQKKNWDKISSSLDDEDETEASKAGGDAALQKLFAGIYANASEDTKRAMIKSFTESGGTALSTDWSSVGKEKVAVRPPEGMEERKY